MSDYRMKVSNLDHNEYEIAKNYCQSRSLYKPKITVETAFKWLGLLELATCALTISAYFVLIRLDVHLSFSTLYFLSGSILFLALLKKICKLVIALYQHYASEKTRRKCVMMPSCSEYALLALEKYNVIKGLYKTYIRMTTKCKGNYKIDYP